MALTRSDVPQDAPRRRHYRPAVRSPLVRVDVWTGVAAGVAFGLFMSAVGRFQDASWTVSAIGGAVAGTLFGVTMGTFFRRQRAELTAVLSGTGSDREARRAGLLRYRLAALERQRVWSTVVYLVLIAIGVAGVLTGTTWQAVPAVLFAVLLVGSWVQRHRLRRAVAALDADQQVR